MTVYVTQEPRDTINISSAKKYGEIKVLTTRSNLINYDQKAVVLQIEEGLLDYSEDDYILCLGDPIIIGIASAIAAINNDNCLNLLKWDRQEQQYMPFTINLNIHNR